MNEFEILDPRFGKLVGAVTQLEKLAGGCRWSEGPAYFAAGRYLVWSDIPNNRMMRFDETDGNVSTFRAPSGHTNGNTVDGQGRLISCEHGGRRVSRTEFDGAVTSLADRFNGKRLNSPNDVVVAADGAIWFTDPDYGIQSDYQGHQAEPEIGSCNVYRIDPGSGAVTAVATDFIRPNGLAFSPDGTKLFVSDSGRTEDAANPAHVRVLDVVEGTALRNDRVFADCQHGLFDGFRFDVEGRMWISTHIGVECYAPDGDLIGRILVPEVVSNCVFGGPNRNRLFITATTSLYAVFVFTRGC